MIEVKLSYKSGYILFFEMPIEGEVFHGGIDVDRHLFVDKGCPYKELMLRAILAACKRTEMCGFTALDEWDVDLSKFGFKRTERGFIADAAEMKLWSECGCKH